MPQPPSRAHDSQPWGGVQWPGIHAYALSAWQEMEEAALKVMEAAHDAEGVLATHAAALGAATAEFERKQAEARPRPVLHWAVYAPDE